MEKVEVGNATLYHGDALEVLATLDDGEIDACVSDPPYAAATFGGKCTACEWDTPVPLTEFWQLIQSKAKPQANIALFCNMKFAYDLIDTNKKGFRYDMVWAKNNRVGFFNANLQPLRSHENVLLFCNKPGNMLTSTYNPHLDAIDCIKKYANTRSLFYVDPPYISETRVAPKTYKHEYTDEQHKQLVETLLAVLAQ